MRKLRNIVLVLSGFAAGISGLQAQELFCNISVNASQIQSDKQVFEDMQQTISRYMNFQQWGPDQFTIDERIRVNFQILVNQRPSGDRFSCTFNIQVYRPTLNATYETIVLNISDKNCSFNYVPFQQMQFVENLYNDELTALLNFYAYLILGFDYDSFSPNGGNFYFQQAQEIVNLAASASNEIGWRSSESTKNRYWIVENLMNSRYRGFHTVLYKYHRQGLDQMESNPSKGRRAIIDALREMQRVHRQDPLMPITRLFLDTKDDELVKVFAKGFANDKKEFIEIMQDIDPSNIAEYNKVME
jgi:hypothetical protein